MTEFIRCCKNAPLAVIQKGRKKFENRRRQKLSSAKSLGCEMVDNDVKYLGPMLPFLSRSTKERTRQPPHIWKRMQMLVSHPQKPIYHNVLQLYKLLITSCSFTIYKF
jgi:hypothetical protein